MSFITWNEKKTFQNHIHINLNSGQTKTYKQSQQILILYITSKIQIKRTKINRIYQKLSRYVQNVSQNSRRL